MCQAQAALRRLRGPVLTQSSMSIRKRTAKRLCHDGRLKPLPTLVYIAFSSCQGTWGPRHGHGVSSFVIAERSLSWPGQDGRSAVINNT